MTRLVSNRSFWLTLLLSIITLGIYGLYLIYAFARETNIACKGDNKKTTGLLLYILLSIVTLGIYAIIWNCMWITRCNDYLRKNRKPEGLQLSTYLLTIFLLGPITIGVMYFVVFAKMLYLQNAVNSTYNKLNNL
jgi:uncharacterized membrane protein YjgN (DUF898 family)